MFREKNISDNLIDKYSKKIINDTNFDAIIKKKEKNIYIIKIFVKIMI